MRTKMGPFNCLKIASPEKDIRLLILNISKIRRMHCNGTKTKMPSPRRKYNIYYRQTIPIRPVQLQPIEVRLQKAAWLQNNANVICLSLATALTSIAMCHHPILLSKRHSCKVAYHYSSVYCTSNDPKRIWNDVVLPSWIYAWPI